jgi:hypothetical protein
MVSDNAKITMIAVINETIKIKKEHPYADAEDIMPTVMHTISKISKNNEAKLAAISAVDLTIKHMDKNPESSEKEIFQNILNRSADIISSLQQDKE